MQYDRRTNGDLVDTDDGFDDRRVRCQAALTLAAVHGSERVAYDIYLNRLLAALCAGPLMPGVEHDGKERDAAADAAVRRDLVPKRWQRDGPYQIELIAVPARIYKNSVLVAWDTVMEQILPDRRADIALVKRLLANQVDPVVTVVARSNLWHTWLKEVGGRANFDSPCIIFRAVKVGPSAAPALPPPQGKAVADAPPEYPGA